MNPQRILVNHNNLLTDADIIASSVKATQSMYLESHTGTGTGQVALTGSYLGSEPKKILKVKIVEGNVGLRSTVPVLSGVGSGTLQEISATGLSPQDIAVTLLNKGTATEQATIKIFDVDIAVKNTVVGEAGNEILIEVDDSGLTVSESIGLTFESLSKGTKTVNGSIWDFNAPALSSDGNIIEDTIKRIQFENYPTVYRYYKKPNESAPSEWDYCFFPAIDNNIPAGTKINLITGSRRVFVKYGNTLETYNNIITYYDFFVGLVGSSNLLTVLGSIEKDLRPEGIAGVEFNEKTDSYVSSIIYSGSDYMSSVEHFIINKDNLNFDTISAVCINNDYPGAETWGVLSKINGILSNNLVTGSVFHHPLCPIDFSIPIKHPSTTGSEGSNGVIRAKVAYTSREEGEFKPPICVKSLVVGAKAKVGSYTFTYKEPIQDLAGCECEKTSTPPVNPKYLGISEGGEDSMGQVDGVLKDKLQMLYDYKKQVALKNTWDIDLDVDIYQKIVGEKQLRLVIYTNATYLPNYIYLPYIGSNAEIDAILKEINNIFPSGIELFNYFKYEKGFINKSPIEYAKEHGSYSSAGFRKIFTEIEKIDYIPGSTSEIEVSDFGSYDPSLLFLDKIINLFEGSLYDLYGYDTALTEWQSLWEDVRTDYLSKVLLDFDPAISTWSDNFFRSITSRLNTIYLSVGLLPPKKADDSDISTGCWSQKTGVGYWESGSYLPAYSNELYYSAKMENEEPKCAQEFAFYPAVTCPQYLKEGDAITIVIDSVGDVSTASKAYQTGDSVSFDIIGKNPLELSGGVTGSDEQTWKVEGSDYGVFSPYILDPSDPDLYTDSGLSFRITQDREYNIGDVWKFSLIGGMFKYFYNDVWSSNLPIQNTQVDTDMRLVFIDGIEPSWVSEDVYNFVIENKFSPIEVILPGSGYYEWDSNDTSIDFDIGSTVTVKDFLLALHTLPEIATVQVSGSNTSDFSSILWTQALTRFLDGVYFAHAENLDACRYLRFNLFNTGGASLGWVGVFNDEPLGIMGELNLTRVFDSRGTGSLYGYTLFNGGKGWSGNLSFEGLNGMDANKLMSLLDGVADSGDGRCCVVPNYISNIPPRLVKLVPDNMEMSDKYAYQPDTGQSSLSISAKLQLEPLII